MDSAKTIINKKIVALQREIVRLSEQKSILRNLDAKMLQDKYHLEFAVLEKMEKYMEEFDCDDHYERRYDELYDDLCHKLFNS